MNKSAKQIASLLEIQEHIHEMLDREFERARRGYKIPVVVEGKLFSCMVDAAAWLARNRPWLWQNSKPAKEMDAYRVMCNLIKRVSRYCNAYSNGTVIIQCRLSGVDLNNWFLAEEGDPCTWEVPPDANWIGFEDLRRK